MRDPFLEKGTDWLERLTVLQHFQPFVVVIRILRDHLFLGNIVKRNSIVNSV